MDKLNGNRRFEKIPRAKKVKKSDDTKKSELEPEPEPVQEIEIERETETETKPELESEIKKDAIQESEEKTEEESETEPLESESESSEPQEIPEKESVAPEIIEGEPEPDGNVNKVEEPKSKDEDIPPSESEIICSEAESIDTTAEPESEPDILDSEVPENESIEAEKFESKIIDYNDFLPTKDTITVITHLDVDGVLCVAAINKMLNSKEKIEEAQETKDVQESAEEKVDGESNENEENRDEIQNRNLRVFFTSPTKIFNTLAKSIPDLNKIQDDDFQIGELYVCDLSVDRDTLLGASIYDKIKWFDHHEIEPGEQYNGELDNSELLIDPLANSATSIICNYFKLDEELSNIADEVDTNDVKTDKAKRIREIVGALRLKYSGSKLKKMLYEFANEVANNVDIINNENYNPIVEDYNKWLDDFRKKANDEVQIQVINDKKVGMLETEHAAPIYAIYDSLKNHPEAPFDILAVMIHKYFRIGKDRNNKYKNKRFTKLEFRTHTEMDILELAKSFGGGGHKFACAATVLDGLEIDDLIKSIESLYSISGEKKDNDDNKN